MKNNLAEIKTLHTPVLLEEVMDCFDHLGSIESPLFLDCTLGGGGHAEALLKRFPNLFLVGLDQDSAALERTKVRLSPFQDRVILVRCNFRNAPDFIQEVLMEKIGAERNNVSIFSGILADLGFSSDQLADPERGFSFLEDSPLDMRMDQTLAKSGADILNNSSKGELKKIFQIGGLGRLSGVLADKVVSSRPINRTSEFAKICESISELSQKSGRSAATIPFQSLRIAVNQELEALEEFMQFSHQLLAPNGKLAMISFHSSEDKIVTKEMRSWERGEQIPRRLPRSGASSGFGKLLTPKALEPQESEIHENPRSRSSRLRVFQRNEGKI